MAENKEYRKFKTGALRTPDDDKLDYEGFLSPLVLERFAQYMHKHRHRADGTLRRSDNWQLGIPVEAYLKSQWRHHVDAWCSFRAGRVDEDLEEQLCAMLFNTQGMLHEILKKRKTKKARKK